MPRDRLIEFQITGKLNPERFAYLSRFLADLAKVGEHVEVLPLSELIASVETAELYRSEYLEQVYLPESNEEVTVVTGSSFRKYFKKNETDKSTSQVARGWSGLTSHYIHGHVHRLDKSKPLAKVICGCPLVGYYRQFASLKYVRDTDVLGFEPGSLYELRDFLKVNPDYRVGGRRVLSPQGMDALQLFLGGLKLPPSEE